MRQPERTLVDFAQRQAGVTLRHGPHGMNRFGLIAATLLGW
jgi:hypothetical protein